MFLTQLAKREKAEVQMLTTQVKEVFEQWAPLIRKDLEEKGYRFGSERVKVSKQDAKDEPRE